MPAFHSFHARPLLMVSSCSTVMASRGAVRRSASRGCESSTAAESAGMRPCCTAMPTSRPTTLLLIERTSCSVPASNATVAANGLGRP
jgi:hypothetical protein